MSTSAIFDDILTSIMDRRLTSDDQKEFCKSYKTYTDYDESNPFVMDLDKVLHDTGYSRKDKAKAAIVKLLRDGVEYQIKTEECYNNLLPQVGEQVREHGGHNKETVLLTIEGFKHLCLSAHNDRGIRTREYFIAMERVLVEYRDTVGRRDIQVAKEKARHDALIRINDHVGCVYLVRVMTLDGGFVFKMGETDNLRRRMGKLMTEYGECVLLDVFPCIMPHTCEQGLRSTPDFKTNQYKGEVNGKTGTELYVCSPTWPWLRISKSVDHAVQTHMKKTGALLEFKRLDVKSEKIALESKRIDLEMEKLRIISSVSPERLEYMVSLLNSISPPPQVGSHDGVDCDDGNKTIESDDDSDNEEDAKQDPPPFYASSSTAIRSQGHQVQRYSMDGKTLLATYETKKDAECDPTLSMNRPHSVKITAAVKSHRVYKGFRWAHLPHGEPAITVQDIGLTVSAPTCRRGPVAILDPTGKVITEVYDSMTDAAKGLDVSLATVSNALTNSTSLGSNKLNVAMLNDCTPEMRDANEKK
jgi:hypothetical protein